MPHAAHFIGADSCMFRMATEVGGFIVSTVGQYWPDRPVREVIARSRGIIIEGRGDDFDRKYMEKIGFEEIGHNRLFETYVFFSKPKKPECGCAFEVDGYSEIDSLPANDPQQAYENHLMMCDKWSKQSVKSARERNHENW